MRAQTLRIAIVGGGIGGLTLALALRQRGLEAEVFEQAPELPEIGATMRVLPLRLVTGATPERVRRAAWSRRASGSPASVSRVERMTVPTPGRERRISASHGPPAAAAASWLSPAHSPSS